MTNKLKYFVGNWKMFGDFKSIKIIYKILNFYKKSKFRRFKNKIIFCVPNTLIYLFKKKLKSKLIYIGGQNCYHKEEYGPYTGAVSPAMIKRAGAEYLILGHSENRLEGETDTIIKKKIIYALKQKLNIIYCIGETLKEKKSKKTFKVLKKQIRKVLEKKFDDSKIILAYEPVWSIGTNKILNSKDLKNTINFIKKELNIVFKNKKNLKILYGGSVNEKNITLFSKIHEIDGFLIGGASQSSKKFIDIIKNYYK